MKLTKEQEERLQKLLVDHAGKIVGEIVEAEFEKRRDELSKGSGFLPEVLEARRRAAEAARDPKDKGTDVARIVRCLALAKNDPAAAAAKAARLYGEDSLAHRALSKTQWTTLTTGDGKTLVSDEEEMGGFLLEDEVAADLIELLRARSVVRQMNPRFVGLRGTARFNKHTAGVTGSYIGEAEPAPTSQPTFGQVVATAKKLAVVVPISNDLIRRSNRDTDQFIRDDIAAGFNTTSDIAMIRADGSAGQPKGLYHWAAAANRLASGTHAPASVTLQIVTTDLGRAIQQLGDANVPMLRPGWIMEWRTWRYLITVRDGNGNLVFKPEMDRGTLFGFPFAVTSQIPRNLDASGSAGNDETELYFADFADVIVAEEERLLLDASPTAAYEVSGSTRAAFSRDETVIRGIQEHDLVVRHPESIVVIEQVVWGA